MTLFAIHCDDTCPQNINEKSSRSSLQGHQRSAGQNSERDNIQRRVSIKSDSTSNISITLGLTSRFPFCYSLKTATEGESGCPVLNRGGEMRGHWVHGKNTCIHLPKHTGNFLTNLSAQRELPSSRSPKVCHITRRINK